jgi:hypothetical protein
MEWNTSTPLLARLVRRAGSLDPTPRRTTKSQPSHGEPTTGTETVAPHAECPVEMHQPHPGSPQVKKTAKSSKTIRANKRKAKLRAKHRRQRARATT